MSENSTSSLNSLISDHVLHCAVCAKAVQGPPVGNLGGRLNRMCKEYWNIVKEWAEGEGSINDIRSSAVVCEKGFRRSSDAGSDS